MTTITRDQFEDAMNASYRSEITDGQRSSVLGFLAFLESLGITIADPQPPEAMVKLAREIAQDVFYEGIDWRKWVDGAALAALQHAAKVVKGAPSFSYTWEGDSRICRNHILTAIGSRP